MMSEIKTQRLHATIEGRVQGVGFRYFVITLAAQKALSGWVGNRLDGSVEVVAEGTQEALNSLLKALHQGPRSEQMGNFKASTYAACFKISHQIIVGLFSRATGLILPPGAPASQTPGL